MFKHTAALLLALPAAFGYDRPSGSGTFRDPSVHVRPKFRYWIPDASINHDIAAKDIRAAGNAGAGGMEALGFYLYGGPPENSGRGTAAPVSWSTYGYGTDAWNSLFRDLLRAHRDNGLLMDFAMGPNQGTGVPAPSDSDGLSWDVAAYNVSVPVGGSFDDILPGWGAGKLQAAVTGLVTKSEDASGVEPGLPGDLPANRRQHTLAASTLEDVTDQVDKDGHLKVNFPSGLKGLHFNVFAVYMFHTLYRAQDGPLDVGGPQTPAKSLAENGSWAVDHFSELGAQTSIDFWEKSILPHGTEELLSQAGNYGWEDSLEIKANVEWTKDMMEIFKKDHGYSLAKWLPTIFHRNGLDRANPPEWWITDEPDSGLSHAADFRITLSKQYNKYISTLTEWVRGRLGLKFSTQAAYNQPIDMFPSIPIVDVPECESLDFSDLVDSYRLFSGPATLGGRNVISSECGAVQHEVYGQTLPELLWHIKLSYAGSINQFVLHGFPYSGNYGNTTYPGYTTFNYQYSGMHGPRDPSFEFYRDQMDYISRNNWALTQGAAKMDVAIWQKAANYPKHIVVRRYDPPDLEDAGYTYEYISPDNFDLPLATVRHGILAPEAQGFKTLVVRGNDTLTLDGVSRLVEYAHGGLPIIFLGGLPTSYLGTNKQSAVQKSQKSLQRLTRLRNVHVMDSYHGLADKLSSLGIQPGAKRTTENQWYTLRRTDTDSGKDYFYIYNDVPDLQQGDGKEKTMVEFESDGIPHQLDAWTGEETPVLTYTQKRGTTTIPITLAGNQTTLVVFHKKNRYNRQAHIADVSDGVLGLTAKHNKVELKVGPRSSPKPSYTRLDGSMELLRPAPGSPTTLTNWKLTVEHWDPPANMSDIEGGANRHNTTHSIYSPIAWQQIPELKNVSGRGYYKTSFHWPPSKGGRHVDGAFIDFGYVKHTLRASVNGHAIPPLDVTRPMADISKWLTHGKNVVEAVVATPMGNGLHPVWDQLETSGTKASDPSVGGPPPAYDDYGLLTDVVVTPYKSVIVD